MEQNYEGLSDAELLAIKPTKDMPIQLLRLIMYAKLREMNSKPRVYKEPPTMDFILKIPLEEALKIAKLVIQIKHACELYHERKRLGFYKTQALPQ